MATGYWNRSKWKISPCNVIFEQEVHSQTLIMIQSIVSLTSTKQTYQFQNNELKGYILICPMGLDNDILLWFQMCSPCSCGILRFVFYNLIP